MIREHKKCFNRVILLGLVLFCLYGIGSIDGIKSEVVIYSAMENFRNKDLKLHLEEEFPNIEITIQYISTNKGTAKLKLEEQRTDADIIIAFDMQSLEQIKDVLADLSQYNDEHYLEDLNPSHDKYKVWEKFAGGIIVNKEVIEKLDLPLPITYEDLLNPIYKDLIAMPDPKSSGTGYFFLKNRVNEIGEKEAFDYFDALYPNIKQFTESGSGPVKLLIQEEVAIGLGMTFQAVGEINKGKPLHIIFPKEGSPYSLSGIGIIEGRQHDKKVKAVFDYLYNDYIFYDKQKYSPEQVFNKQQNTILNYPQNIQYANMNGLSSAKEKKRLLEEWKY